MIVSYKTGRGLGLWMWMESKYLTRSSHWLHFRDVTGLTLAQMVNTDSPEIVDEELQFCDQNPCAVREVCAHVQCRLVVVA